MVKLPAGVMARAPEHESEPPGRALPSTVSLFGPDGRGIRLATNQLGLGYRLSTGATGLGPAPIDNELSPLTQGGAILRTQRVTESDIILPIQIRAASGRELRRMIAKLISILTPGEGYATLAVYSPYTNEARYARVLYESGLENPEWDAPKSEKFTVSLTRIDPYWFGEARTYTHGVAPAIKPYITKDFGEPDLERAQGFYPDQLEEPRASEFPEAPDFVKVSIPDSESSTTTVGLSSSYDTESGVYTFQAVYRLLTGEASISIGVLEPDESFSPASDQEILDLGSGWTLIEGRNGVSQGQTPSLRVSNLSGGLEILLAYLWFKEDKSTESLPNQEVEILRGSGEIESCSDPRIGGYEFPFFPIWISESVVQGKLDFIVEGDAPTYPTITIRGPGRDPQFIFTGGRELFIPGDVESPITAIFEPQEEDIYDESGPLWYKLLPKRRAMPALQPGRNTIDFSMVESTIESQVVIEYRELWRHAH